MNFKCSYTRLVPTGELLMLQNPDNPNEHPKEQVEALAEIIKFQGQRSPVVISKRSGFITKGHLRLMSMHNLGWTEIAVDDQDYLTEAQEYADIVADNEIARWAITNTQKVMAKLKDIDLGDLSLLGFQDASALANKILDMSEFNIEKELEENKIEVGSLNDGVMRAIQIEFNLDDYEVASEIIKSMRSQDIYVGGEILEFLKQKHGDSNAEN